MFRGLLCLPALATVFCLAGLAPQALAGQDAGAAKPKTAAAAAKTAATTADDKSARPASTTYTRFVVGLDRDADYDVLLLSNPNRVVVELSDVNLRLPDMRAATGLVKSFRGGLAAAGKSRVVIEVTQPVIVESARIEKATSGYKLSLDILSVEAAFREGRKAFKTPPSGLGAAGLQPPLPKPAPSKRERDARTYKPIIVLDPGHGGDDSGATRNGAVEKHVVLAFSHVLRKQLEKTGRYKVLMTRDKDVFIPLGDRVAFAERNSASIFMAIHADYAQSRARGATIFSLRDNVAKSLKRSTLGRSPEKVLSSAEINTVKNINADTNGVTDILADLAERDVELTKERTDLFTKSVIGHMSESTTMRSEPDQQAAFRVLKTAQFPSVLIELAYVTNKEDAQNLQSDAWREKVAESIVQAIDNYFSNEVAFLPM